MIITLTYEGKPLGSPMNDLSGERLLQFIKDEMELGRTVHIQPEKKDLWLWENETNDEETQDLMGRS